MKKYIIVCLTVFYGVCHADKVPRSNELVYKYLSLAKSSNKARNYTAALYYYNKLDSLLPYTPEIYFEKGACYLNLRQPRIALPYLQFAKEKELNYEELYYFLGKAYHENHYFDEAIEAYKQYIKDLSIDTANVDSLAIKEAYRNIEVCNFAKEIVSDTVPVEIENIGEHINTQFDEYVPIVSADQQVMYFTSRRPTMHNDKLSRDGKHYEDIHVTSIDSTGKWSSARTVRHPVNEAEHDACIGMTADGQTLFLYKIKSANPTKGNIYMSKLNGNSWTKPKKLGSHVNTRKGWEASVSISEDNQRLYFSSDKPGGYGGMDIWYCELMPNNEWSEPKNMGPIINSKYNEDCPFIHYDDKTLFFSSNGHKTMGGFDVFSSVYDAEKKTWSEPRNIGYPINTVDDDMYFVYSADGSKGYMSSAIRQGGLGGEDIYVVNRPNHSKHMISLSGKILDEDGNPVEATITVTDLEKNKITNVLTSNSISGKYVLALDFGKNYSVQIECKNHIFLSENINVNNSEVIFSEHKDFTMKKLKVGNSLVLNNLFYDYKKVELNDESLPELDKLLEFMKYHPHVYIEIASHTDSIGSDAFNFELSEQRALGVRNYLSARGVPKKNMKIKAYGETKPIASNSTIEGRSRNRRTECLILNIDTLSKEQLEKIAQIDTVGDEKVALHAVVEKEKVGEILIPKVYFAYNDGQHISERSRQNLDNVYAALKRIPNLKLELVAYTDGVGSEFKNKTLYDERIHTVCNYLKEKGIALDKLTMRAYDPSSYKKIQAVKKGNIEKRKVEFVLTSF